MNHEQLVLKAVLVSRRYNKQLNKEALLKTYSKVPDSLLKACMEEEILIHAEEPEFIPDGYLDVMYLQYLLDTFLTMAKEYRRNLK